MKPSFNLRSINKWQAVVLILAIGVAAWVLLKAYVFRGSCLHSICPVYDPTVWPRLAFLAVCTVLALWLLKTSPASETTSKNESMKSNQTKEAE